MEKNVFLYSGEGTHDNDTGFKLLESSTYWQKAAEILDSKLNLNLELVWNREIGRHRCPFSPLLTVISQICLSDIWRRWGYHPDVIIGHSTGELAAAHQAGLYELEDILLLAYRIGEAAARMDGMMIHGRLPDPQIETLSVYASSFNFVDEAGRHITLSGYPDEMNAFLVEHPGFVKMKLPHPWHHPDYKKYSDQVPLIESASIPEGRFVSGITTEFETRLDDAYWRKWLVSPVDFIQSMQTVKGRLNDSHLNIFEIGFHPVLEKCCNIFREYTYVSSMFRGENDVNWISFQRKKLDQSVFKEELRKTVEAFRPRIDFSKSLAYQGFGSLEFMELSIRLQPYFPSLAPQDFYRYKTIDQLIDRFGIEKSIEPTDKVTIQKNDVVISAMSCRFPASVETPAQFWDMLVGKQDQVKPMPERAGTEAGFLDDTVTRFDHLYFNIPPAEARTMDPQQILALELAEMLWQDAGIDPETLDKKRVGVYLGVWSQEYPGDRKSVFYPTGTNPSIIASRISYHYDLRGPSWVSNTACSSSLVAVHYAIKDIEAGRVDYAIAGGVNMLLDEEFTVNMKNSGFLSPDNRCKAFDDTANGYVRAEGGGLVLLAGKALATTYYAELKGSAINQNGRRAQVITAPHPEAQEEVITAACQDAGISPGDIAYVECHGTGTKIGDPIEIAAIQNTIAKNRKGICHIGSVKSNMGHLESAAGIAGLIKSVAALCRGTIPPNLHFRQPNQYIDFDSHNLHVVTEETKIDHQAYIGISSFGFGGSNAHIIIKGVDASVRKVIKPQQIPFDRNRAPSLSSYIRLHGQSSNGSSAGSVDDASATNSGTAQPAERENDQTAGGAVSREDIDRLVGKLFFELTNIEKIDPDIELTEQGLDSLSGTEMISQLETALGVEIEPDFLFEHPLREQFVDKLYTLATGVPN